MTPQMIGTCKVNRELLEDHQDIGEAPTRLLRIHLDIPVPDEQKWTRLKNVFENAKADEIGKVRQAVIDALEPTCATQQVLAMIEAAFASPPPSDR